MLPPGFEWRPLLDGSAVYLGAVQVANLTPLEGGRVRACPNANNARSMRYQFFSGQVEAEGYVERWAGKWEVALRAGTD